MLSFENRERVEHSITVRTVEPYDDDDDDADDDDDDDDDKPVWPTWAVGALFRGVRRVLINHALYRYNPRGAIPTF
jgi:hypothetical protein